MSQLIAKRWSDEGFKRKLLADPAATLKAKGMELTAGLSVKALENTEMVFHLVIPAKPTDLYATGDGLYPLSCSFSRAFLHLCSPQVMARLISRRELFYQAANVKRANTPDWGRRKACA